MCHRHLPGQLHVIVKFANKIRNWDCLSKSIVEADVVLGMSDCDSEKGSTCISRVKQRTTIDSS